MLRKEEKNMGNIEIKTREENNVKKPITRKRHRLEDADHPEYGSRSTGE